MTESSPESEKLIDAIKQFTAVIERQSAQQRDWRLAVRNGLLAGLGGVIGATVVVSLLVWVLQPFRQLQAIGPMIDHLDASLAQSHKR